MIGTKQNKNRGKVKVLSSQKKSLTPYCFVDLPLRRLRRGRHHPGQLRSPCQRRLSQRGRPKDA